MYRKIERKVFNMVVIVNVYVEKHTYIHHIRYVVLVHIGDKKVLTK